MIIVANTQLVYYVFLEAGLVLVATNLPSLGYFVSKATIPDNSYEASVASYLWLHLILLRKVNTKVSTSRTTPSAVILELKLLGTSRLNSNLVVAAPQTIMVRLKSSRRDSICHPT